MKLLALLLAFCCSAVLAAPPQAIEARAVVKPVTDLKESGNGSGVMVAKGLLVTAAHVVENSGAKQLFVKDGKRMLPLKLKAINKTADVALLEVDLDCPCAELGTKIDLDEPIFTVGYPIGASIGFIQFLTEGRAQAFGENDSLWSDAPTVPGNSGGGVFQVQDGQLVLVGISKGVVGNGTTFFSHLSNAANVKHVRELMR